MKRTLLCALISLILYSPSALSSENITSWVSDAMDSLTAGESEGGIPIGLGSDKLWRLRPGFEYKTTYDSNVNREPSGRRDHDIIFNYTPSFDLTRRGTRLGVDLGYVLDYEQFLRDSDQSHFDHTFNLLTDYTGERLNVSIPEKFGFMEAYASSEQSERRPFFYNDIYPEIKYKITPKVSASVLYRNYLFQYRDSILKSSSYAYHEIGGRNYYHLTPKTDIYIHGAGTVTDYYRRGVFDSSGYLIYAGTRGKLTEKLLTDTYTGVRGRSYDNKTANSYYNWIWEGMMEYKVSSKLNSSLTLKRDIEESVYQTTGWYGVHMFDVGLHYALTEHMKLQTSLNYQNNHYSKDTSEVGQGTKKRDDDIVAVSASFTWNPYRALSWSTGYSVRNRHSNFSTFDYTEHTVDSALSIKL